MQVTPPYYSDSQFNPPTTNTADVSAAQDTKYASLADQINAQSFNPVMAFYEAMNSVLEFAGQMVILQSQLIQQHNQEAANTKQASANLGATINGMTDANSTADLPSDVKNTCEQYDVVITWDGGSGSIDDYLKAIGKEDGKDLDKEQLTRIQSALDNTSDQYSSLSSQDQMKTQQQMQTYATASSNMTTALNNVKTMLDAIVRNMGV
ncbi:hypothetical protein THUN1379_27070 [Paludibacterium sp. THUN1379]|uniref:hypothetical protein n=1 Tax=Paludibacterium sp. THUN1379 TaxID=3112107 RepID=UPI00308538D0|nr:hypothetical protein THUN1379_27070 [Paludibacterium sp. THUN1379]